MPSTGADSKAAEIGRPEAGRLGGEALETVVHEILRLHHVSKSFVGVKAMQDVSFDLRAGEVHCLCGENGAGKSTLIKVLSGAHQPDEGTISFEGQKVTLTPHLALAL